MATYGVDPMKAYLSNRQGQGQKMFQTGYGYASDREKKKKDAEILQLQKDREARAVSQQQEQLDMAKKRSLRSEEKFGMEKEVFDEQKSSTGRKRLAKIYMQTGKLDVTDPDEKALVMSIVKVLKNDEDVIRQKKDLHKAKLESTRAQTKFYGDKSDDLKNRKIMAKIAQPIKANEEKITRFLYSGMDDLFPVGSEGREKLTNLAVFLKDGSVNYQAIGQYQDDILKMLNASKETLTSKGLDYYKKNLFPVILAKGELIDNMNGKINEVRLSKGEPVLNPEQHQYQPPETFNTADLAKNVGKDVSAFLANNPSLKGRFNQIGTFMKKNSSATTDIKKLKPLLRALKFRSAGNMRGFEDTLSRNKISFDEFDKFGINFTSTAKTLDDLVRKSRNKADSANIPALQYFN